jgi:hypothetical protein
MEKMQALFEMEERGGAGGDHGQGKAMLGK